MDMHIVYINEILTIIWLRREDYMAVSYNGLWKLLIDNNMKKIDLIQRIGISSSTLAKMSKGEHVSLSILGKICESLDCDFGDLINYVKEEKNYDEI
jgi:DNA-binding Xre family transcriptional regulator